jgi:hypothetical protein
MLKPTTQTKTDVYTQNGYKDRTAYLENLAGNYGVDSYVVHMMADILGDSEDFDGLITGLEDMDYAGALDAFRDDC